MRGRVALLGVALLLSVHTVFAQHGLAAPALGASCAAYGYSDNLTASAMFISVRSTRRHAL